MNYRYKTIVDGSRWFDESETNTENIDATWLSWLSEQGSLTTRLTEFANGNFKVNVLDESWAKPNSREADKLNVSVSDLARIRQVELLCDDQVVVFARSIIPKSVFEAQQQVFATMGSKPLGHFLFKDGQAQKRQRNFTAYSVQNQTVYGRVTPYIYQGGEILVSEYFVNPVLVEN